MITLGTWFKIEAFIVIFKTQLFYTSFCVWSERSLVLHERLSELQQLSVLLGVHPPQVLHVLDHHLHGFADTVLLMVQTPGGPPSWITYGNWWMYVFLTWWMAPSISERLETLVIDWMRMSRFFWSLWMISMDWLSSSQRGIRAWRERKSIGKGDLGRISVSRQPPGIPTDLPGVSPGSWTPLCGRSPPPGHVTAPPVSVSSPVWTCRTWSLKPTAGTLSANHKRPVTASILPTHPSLNQNF